MPRQERVRRENPRSNRHRPGLCASCFIVIPVNPGEDFCEECRAALQEQQENQEASHEAYLEERQARYEQDKAEWEEWREKRRQKREAEREAYEILKEERRAEKLANDPDHISWMETLGFLARMGCRS